MGLNVDFFFHRSYSAWFGVLRFGYLGKWSPCVCELLNTSGKNFVPCTLCLISL
jgi:hypothetical protein